MLLPNATGARVERRKIIDYLLNATHPDGASKARFFTRFGFRLARWQVLAHALREHGRTQPVVRVVESAFGTRYNVEGPLAAPDGRSPCVRTVWIVEPPSTVPRLITAYPA